jgi:putative heme-binding domain-containing protein
MKLIGDFRARRNNTDQTVTRLLSSPSSALSLLDYFLLAEVPGERFGNRMDKNATGMRKLVAQQAKDSQQPVIRDMFERYLPHDQRVRRIGNSVNVDQLLALAGDRQAGRRLFFESKTMRCKNCHKVGELGGNFGPNLTKLSKQRSREQILESIIAPSKKIDPKFQLMLLETKKGRVHNGLIEKRTNEQITLRTAHDKRVTIKTTNIELLVPQQKSSMPDLLYRDLTAQQLADLLAFLSSAQ